MRYIMIRLMVLMTLTLTVFSVGVKANQLGVVWENDLFAGTDYRYTNGLGLFWARDDLSRFRQTPATLPLRWAAGPLGFGSGRYSFRAVSHELLQSIQTPDNINLPRPEPRDLPYAGLLAWKGSIYAANGQVANRFSMLAGLVGPGAGARPAQHLAHHLFKGNHPRGWAFQLHNEPVANLAFSRHWRVWHQDAGELEEDLIPGARVDAGLLKSDLMAGAMVRVGHHLAESFPGVSLAATRHIEIRTRPDQPYWYVYAGMAGRLVGNDLLIQGNLFQDSAGTRLKHAGYNLALGAVWGAGPMTVGFTFVDRSPRARTVSGDDRFGSVAVSWAY